MSEGTEFALGMIMLHPEERIFQMAWKAEGQYLGDQEKFPAYNLLEMPIQSFLFFPSTVVLIYVMQSFSSWGLNPYTFQRQLLALFSSGGKYS